MLINEFVTNYGEVSRNSSRLLKVFIFAIYLNAEKFYTFFY